MRYYVYFNIFEAVSTSSNKLSELGQLDKLTDHISDLETLFNDPIVIGGSKQQQKIEIPDCLNEEFDINMGEFDFDLPKYEEEKSPTKENISESPSKSQSDISKDEFVASDSFDTDNTLEPNLNAEEKE